MNTRAAYLTQILDKIGAPLMQAITGNLPIEGDPAIAAERMAELVARTIALSIKIGEEAKLNTPENDDDAVRVALITLAAPLVAQHYQDFRKVPSDNDLQKIMNGLGAVLTFSENFTGMSETISILESLPEKDARIKQIRYINGALPVVNAVAVFSFGQPETKLASDIVSRLTARTETLLEDLSPENMNDSTDKRMVFSALASLYAECHLAETRRLSESEVADGATIDSVWKAFEVRAQMLEVVCGAALGALPQDIMQTSAFSPVSKPDNQGVVQNSPSVSPDAPSVPDGQKNEEPGKEEPKAESRPPSTGGGNPMSLFSTKPPVAPAQKIVDDIHALQQQDTDEGGKEDGLQEGDDSHASSGASSSPAPSLPVSAPSAPPAVSPQGEAAEKPAVSGGTGGGSPMSFFKSPPKSDEDDE